MTFLVITGIILAFLIFLLFMPLGVGAKYENGTFVIVKIAFFSFDIPVNKLIGGKKQKKKKITEKSKKPEEEIEKSIVGLDFILSLLGDFRRFVRKGISLSDFKFNLTFGTADAASTAVTTGLLYTLVYNLLGLIDKLMKVEQPEVNITPIFNEATFAITAVGIIRTTLAHIIATAIVFAYKFLKYKSQKRRKSK
ncbi:MAG: DUF2953 domain-containing protein [Clostridia bacterium]|nr:DUF2953 domain-containing protein [Clostridia bacterium]